MRDRNREASLAATATVPARGDDGSDPDDGGRDCEKWLDSGNTGGDSLQDRFGCDRNEARAQFAHVGQLMSGSSPVPITLQLVRTSWWLSPPIFPESFQFAS